MCLMGKAKENQWNGHRNLIFQVSARPMRASQCFIIFELYGSFNIIGALYGYFNFGGVL